MFWQATPHIRELWENVFFTKWFPRRAQVELCFFWKMLRVTSLSSRYYQKHDLRAKTCSGKRHSISQSSGRWYFIRNPRWLPELSRKSTGGTLFLLKNVTCKFLIKLLLTKTRFESENMFGQATFHIWELWEMIFDTKSESHSRALKEEHRFNFVFFWKMLRVNSLLSRY